MDFGYRFAMVFPPSFIIKPPDFFVGVPSKGGTRAKIIKERGRNEGEEEEMKI